MPGAMKPADLMSIRKLSKWYLLHDLEQRRFELVVGDRDPGLVDLAGLRVAAGQLADDADEALPRLKPTSPATRMMSLYAGS